MTCAPRTSRSSGTPRRRQPSTPRRSSQTCSATGAGTWWSPPSCTSWRCAARQGSGLQRRFGPRLPAVAAEQRRGAGLTGSAAGVVRPGRCICSLAAAVAARSCLPPQPPSAPPSLLLGARRCLRGGTAPRLPTLRPSTTPPPTPPRSCTTSTWTACPTSWWPHTTARSCSSRTRCARGGAWWRRRRCAAAPVGVCGGEAGWVGGGVLVRARVCVRAHVCA